MKVEKAVWFQYMRNWLELPVVLPIRTLLVLETLLYSLSSQRHHLDDDVHRLSSLCHSLGMFHLLFWGALPSLLTHDLNSFTDYNAKNFSTIQLILVFCPLRLNHHQRLREPDYMYVLLIIKVSSGIKPRAYTHIAIGSPWVVSSFDKIYFPPVMTNLEGFM